MSEKEKEETQILITSTRDKIHDLTEKVKALNYIDDYTDQHSLALEATYLFEYVSRLKEYQDKLT